MTSEQIVTDILVANQILKPMAGFTSVNCSENLGAYLSNLPDETEPEINAEKLQEHNSKYTFIDLQKKWL